jgi:hypothetical protein
MKYLIIDTWNGEGYSESGIIDIAMTEAEAVNKIVQEFAERYLSLTEDFKCEWMLGKSISFDNGEDQGCVQYLEVGIDDRYVIINPMENEAKVTSDNFNSIKIMLTDMGSTEESIEALEQEILQIGHGMVEHNDGELIIQKI